MCRADGTLSYAVVCAGINSGVTKQIRAYGSVSGETIINYEDTRGVASVEFLTN